MPAWKEKTDSAVLEDAHLPRIKPEVEIYSVPLSEHEYRTRPITGSLIRRVSSFIAAEVDPDADDTAGRSVCVQDTPTMRCSVPAGYSHLLSEPEAHSTGISSPWLRGHSISNIPGLISRTLISFVCTLAPSRMRSTCDLSVLR